MFYAMKASGPTPVRPGSKKRREDCIGYVTLPELAQYEDALSVSVKKLERCIYEQATLRPGLKDYDGFSLALLKLVQIRNVETDCAYLACMLQEKLCVFVEIKDPDGYFRGQFEEVLKSAGTKAVPQKVVYDFFERFLQDGNAALEETEQTIITMERHLVEGNLDKNMNKRIFEWKRQLTILKNYYHQLAGIGAGLMEDEHRFFSQEEIPYFRLFTEQAKQLSENAQQLCGELIHVREALDAALNYDLNSIMKVFTVVTTIFMPLSLIAGWYGMNFSHMPELNWIYGYPMVMVLSLLVVAGCLIFFKWKKLL